MKIVDINESTNLGKLYGGKASGLELLQEHGLNVPYSVFIESIESTYEFNEDDLSLLKDKMIPLEESGIYDVAIRSSSNVEDSFSESYAGLFKTVFVKTDFAGVINAIREIVNYGTQASEVKMGVIVQRRIYSDYSGVVFTSNPLSFSKKEMMLSYVQGMGEGLVSGKSQSVDILVECEDDSYTLSNNKVFNSEIVANLCSSAKALENELQYPLDIEWAVFDERLYFLQCRPIASITKIHSSIYKVDSISLKECPDILLRHDKVKLRLDAHKQGVSISDAYLYVNNCCDSNAFQMDMISKSPYCSGYSAVMLYPEKVSNKVMRCFVGDKESISETTMGCCRYGVRSYPQYSSIDKCVNAMSTIPHSDYWITATILQEIYDPLYTGIISKQDNSYIIEITKGHFLSKGIVPSSRYVVSNNTVVSYNEVHQYKWYKLVEGHVIECVCNDNDNTLVSLKLADLLCIISSFSTLLSNDSSVVEFGVLKNGESVVQPYLIDFVDDSGEKIKADNANLGIISAGIRIGVIRHIDVDSLNSFDLHFHDDLSEEAKNFESAVFFCKRPDIGLTNLLSKYSHDKIAFVFEEGSMLCHLSVLLREYNIPAIILKNASSINYPEGAICQLCADSDKSNQIERVKILDSFAMSYHMPDTDGVACSIAMAFLKNSMNGNCTPIVIGDLNDETKFVMKELNIDIPLCAQKIPSEISSIVLVDTHHKDQLDNDFPYNKVVEIVDHHPLGDPDLFNNAEIDNRTIGAAASIVAERLLNSKIINEAIYKLLQFAIISNTLNFKAPSTSDFDKEIYEKLQQVFPISTNQIDEMFIAKSKHLFEDLKNTILSDVKKVNSSDGLLAISQLEVPGLLSQIDILKAEKILSEIESSMECICLFNGVDIATNQSVVICGSIEGKRVVEKLFNVTLEDSHKIFDRILLRKTDFFPKLEKRD